MSSSSRPPSLTRPITAESAVSVERWQPPSVQFQSKPSRVEDVAPEEIVLPLTAERIEEIQRQAYQEAYDQGFSEGRAAGLASGQQLVRQQAEQLRQLVNALAQPFEELDEQVEHSLVDLAILIAKNIIRREVKANPGQIVAAVRETIALLPLGSRDIRLLLHPDDAAFVREALSVTEEQQSWRIVDEPTITRGGCRVLTEYSQIDATLETRIAAVIAQVLGGEREQDSAEG